MSYDISGFGSSTEIQASNTFPVGFTLDEYADDADPFDVPSIQIADATMGLNGDLLITSKATPIKVTINVIPGSDNDKNLGILLEANRVGRGKKGARDKITLTHLYPDGNPLILTEGAITDGMVANSIASAGRLKSKSYSFAFEGRAGSP